MAAVSLTTLRTRARQRADQVGSTFVPDSAVGLDAWINEGAQKLHELLVQAFDEEYLEKTSSVNLVAGTTDYALPSDFLKLLGVEIQIGSRWVTVRPYTRAERNAFRAMSDVGPAIPRYRLAGGYLRFLPEPSSANSARLIYAPVLQVLQGGTGSTYINLLTGASDTIDFPNGWERYVVAYAAKQLIDAEEGDSRALAGELEKMEGELRRVAEDRDAAMPHSAVDVDLVDYDPWTF